MKSIEKIKEEYALFESDAEKASSNIEDVYGYIGQAIREIDEDRVDIIKAIKTNCLRKLRGKICNIISFQKEDIAYYDEDNAFLNDEVDLNLIYKYYFSTMAQVLSSENICDITKLFDFTVKSYQSNVDYLEEKREILDCQRSFISYTGVVEEDESVLSFQEFFKEEIGRITSQKESSKSKIKVL